MANGQSITSSQGTITAEGGDGNVALTGDVATSASGTAALNRLVPLRSRKVGGGTASAVLSGAVSTGATGTVVHTESFALVGQSSPIGQGTLFYRGQATIQWIANTEPDLAGYTIYHGTSPGVYNGADTVTLGLVTSYVYGGLLPGMTHYFAVDAFDTSNNHSAKSLEVSKTF